MTEPSIITELLARGADDAVAFSAPECSDLTYGALRQHVERTVASLNRLGIRRNDRVGIVLPNGAAAASAFVSIAAGATTAPLNPKYRSSEFEFYLGDLSAKALVVEHGSSSPALDAARKLKIPIVELHVEAGAPAGAFSLHAAEGAGTNGAPSLPGLAAADDVALVLHTSGTTSRPKIVPLTHSNICASAGNIGNTLRLSAEDRCMNIMPLFHIHGLMAAVLSTLRAGASVYCTPGFNMLKFYAWLDDAKPTWYTAVPTMHQLILLRADKNKEIIDRTKLRFIRSSSSSLPPRVMAELEKLFDAPAVEAYAMTEASHQMTCNPLPPGERKPGTVGPAAGPDVSIMDSEGKLLGAGVVGEVVIRGPNVTQGYENNPKANQEAFTHGWLRTGDQGGMDTDGYVTITGRLKEIINRGGEKISPREVDEVLLDHPSVAQAAAFAMPSEKLGEEVAAVIVLRDGAEATERDIRTFTTERLAAFKVPRKIFILDEIPKGPTGKVQRTSLAKILGIT